MQDEAPTPGPSPTHEGVEEWLDLVDHALQGVHHGLNNRIGSLSAVVELYQLGDLPSDGSGFASLAADLTRLTDCNRVLRLLPRDSIVGEEALILDDVLADVLAIHRYLHSARDVAVTIVPTRYVEPVRVERWALVRVLTLLLADAKRLARARYECSSRDRVRRTMGAGRVSRRHTARRGNAGISARTLCGACCDVVRRTSDASCRSRRAATPDAQVSSGRGPPMTRSHAWPAAPAALAR